MKYGTMTLTVENVTPSIAEKWLQQNDGNRRLRWRTVAMYCRDMLEENWERKPVAVCFDELGRLGNGQHTLTAIVKSGKDQQLLVARGVSRKAISMMDRGLSRSLNDVAKFIGADIDSRKATVARILKWGPGNQQQRSFDELFEAYQEHLDVIDFVCETAPRKAGLNAAVLSVCAKAAYTKDHDKIQRFIDVMNNGLAAGDQESAAIRLRDFCRSLKAANSQNLREETYSKAMSALSSFLDGKPLAKLYGTAEDRFPIPVEMTARTAQGWTADVKRQLSTPSGQAAVLNGIF